MTQATLPRPDAREDPDDQHGLPMRPIEDRSFEAVETTVGVVVGATLGTAVAGPVGLAIGAVAGGAAAFAVAEVVERSQGLASLTTDAEDPRRERR